MRSRASTLVEVMQKLFIYLFIFVTDCGVRARNQQAEGGAAEGDQPPGGEEGGGRAGCC